MKAIAAKIGDTTPTIIDLPEPRLSEKIGCDDILCRTLELGICGTDREILLSEAPWTPNGESYLVLGHECLARVEAVGEAVTDWQPGDLAVPAVRRSLPNETRRLDYLALGKFTERGIFFEHGFSSPLWLDKSQHLYKVPTEVAEFGVFTEPLAVAEKGINEAQNLQQARLGNDVWTDVKPRVLVTGMGPIGFAAVLASRVRGWPVTMVGRDSADSFRATLAKRLGAHYRSIAEATFDDAENEEQGVDLILECTGSDEVMVNSTSALRSCGVMVWLGCSRIPQPASLAVSAMMQRGLLGNHLHIGCVNAAPRDFRDAIHHLTTLSQSNRDELRSLFTARVSMDDSLWHFQNREPQGIKTVIEYAR